VRCSSKNQFRAFGVFLQFLPQTGNIDVHGARDPTAFVPPNLLQ
jgi:hypothetical protein